MKSRARSKAQTGTKTGVPLSQEAIGDADGPMRRRPKPPDRVHVRYELRRASEVNKYKSWYDEAEGLVPPSVLGHIVRYGLYSRE